MNHIAHPSCVQALFEFKLKWFLASTAQHMQWVWFHITESESRVVRFTVSQSENEDSSYSTAHSAQYVTRLY